MKKLLIIFIFLSSVPLSYAEEINQAITLDHHSWISGGNEQVRIIEGHIETNIDNNKNSNFQEGFKRTEKHSSKT